MLYPCYNTVGGSAGATRTTFSKVTYNVLVTDNYVAQIGVYTPGTDAGGATVVQLPDAATYGAGRLLIVADESGSIRPVYRIAVTPYSTQLIDALNLPVILCAPYQSVALLCTGTGWKQLSSTRVSTKGTHLDGSLTKGQVHAFNDCDIVSASSTSQAELRLVASGGAVNPYPQSGSRDGVWGCVQITAGTSSGHYGLLSLGDPNYAKRSNRITKHFAEVLASLNGDTTAIDGTDNYIARAGLSNTRNASAPTDGMWFCIDRSQSTTKLCIACANAGSGTTLQVTSIDIPATNTGHRYFVEVNDALTECYFFYDDTYVATLNTNVPLSTAQDVPFAQAVWVAGSQKGFWVDYLRHHYISLAAYLRVTE